MFFFILGGVLVAFQHWLQGALHMKTHKSASQMLAAVKANWEAIRSSPAFRPGELLDLGRMDEAWFWALSQRWRPGTVKSYLHSLSLFYQFLMAKGLVNKDRVEKSLTGIKTLIRVQGRSVRVHRTE